jgi:hypothetical protein
VLIIVIAALAVFLCISIGAIIDAAKRPSEAFVAVGESKSMWITLIVVCTLFLGLGGFILSLVYLFSIRPKVRNGPSGSSTTMASASRRPWNYFAMWMLVGGAYAMVIAGAFTIGIFFIPIAIIATIFLVRGPSSRRGAPGLIAGLALPVLYVAYLNRSGPGYVCTTSRGAGGSVTSCGSEYNPWLFLAAGMALLGVGVGVFINTSRSKNGRQCVNCPQLLDSEGHYCPSCGTPR